MVQRKTLVEVEGPVGDAIRDLWDKIRARL
jgi:hypothetical protein